MKDELTRLVEAAETLAGLPPLTLVKHADGGLYEHLGQAIGAGQSRGQPALEIYRSTQDGQLYFRQPADFRDRFTPQEK